MKKLKQNNLYIKANSDLENETIHLIEADAEALELVAAEEQGDDSPKLKKFSITAYTGGKMNVGFGMPVVVDLSGLKVSAKARPILKDHDPSKVVGHTTSIKINAGSITAQGVVSGANQHVDEIVASSGQGFPWQASIGAQIDSAAEVDRGETVQVNGRTFKGPLIVARKSTLKEISFVALGADDNTNARVAAKNRTPQPETIDMDFNEWLKAKGFDPENLEEAQQKSLKAMYDAEIAASADDGDGEPEPKEEPFDMKAALSEYKDGVKRIEAVKKVAKDHPEILAKAIDNDWDETRTELEVLRAKRPEAPNVNVGGGEDDSLTSEVLTAAVCLSGNLANMDKQFDEKTLEAAHKRYKGRIGLQELLVEAARANGYSGSPSYRRDARGVLQAAFSQNIQASGGFSTLSITDILSNTANKFLLAGYNSVESGWRSVSAVASVSDFKTHTRYRLTGDMKFEKVGAGGEIKHGTLGDQTFTNKAETYAKMVAITRQDQINDDLGALTSVPQMMGADAARNLNTVFWTEFMDNTSFFTGGNNNLETSNALAIDGLTTAEQAFFDQTDPDGNPLGIMPSVLLVPNALNVTASQIMNSTEVNEQAVADSATGVQVGNSNPHAGKFSIVRSSYLSNANITGNSTTTWYLLANPSELPVIETAFLDGVQNPTIETADADFSTLGIQMRGWMDFGIAKQDYRAGVKNEA